nr:hypothetical protein [Tanacetum cinerariifolium]
MMMRFNEIYKFSDGTLQQIDEALDYRVKEFRINKMNPGLNTRFWTRKDVDRCNAFMFTIQRRLRRRRIFRNLESFVGGRVAVCSSLRSHKSKRTIESKAKRSSKIISLGHYSILLASSHTGKNGNPARANIKQALGRLVTKVCHALTTTRMTTVNDDDEVAHWRNAGRTFKVADQNLLTTKTMDDEDAPGLKALLVDNVRPVLRRGATSSSSSTVFVLVAARYKGLPCAHNNQDDDSG